MSHLWFPDRPTVVIPSRSRPTLQVVRDRFPEVNPAFTSIVRDVSPEESVLLRVGSISNLDRHKLPGLEYRNRLTPILDKTLGFQQALWLYDNQGSLPHVLYNGNEEGVDRKVNGVISMDFPAFAVMDEWERERVPCLYHDGNRIKFVWSTIADGFNPYHGIAING